LRVASYSTSASATAPRSPPAAHVISAVNLTWSYPPSSTAADTVSSRYSIVSAGSKDPPAR